MIYRSRPKLKQYHINSSDDLAGHISYMRIVLPKPAVLAQLVYCLHRLMGEMNIYIPFP